ncbi:hypothetical protein SCHPADRAFT_896797 [Schizopora paradoxa]|uniref:Uncharacterized protein n=1 Tax=Schizopora paradoxa TaxID=27342 RepID=A0A0H2RIS3_9AGAM|nr:hypothetical protein SCHPADRAFT_896797 [Schizopora paradoxa]
MSPVWNKHVELKYRYNPTTHRQLPVFRDEAPLRTCSTPTPSRVRPFPFEFQYCHNMALNQTEIQLDVRFVEFVLAGFERAYAKLGVRTHSFGEITSQEYNVYCGPNPMFLKELDIEGFDTIQREGTYQYYKEFLGEAMESRDLLLARLDRMQEMMRMWEAFTEFATQALEMQKAKGNMDVYWKWERIWYGLRDVSKPDEAMLEDCDWFSTNVPAADFFKQVVHRPAPASPQVAPRIRPRIAVNNAMVAGPSHQARVRSPSPLQLERARSPSYHPRSHSPVAPPAEVQNREPDYLKTLKSQELSYPDIEIDKQTTKASTSTAITSNQNLKIFITPIDNHSGFHHAKYYNDKGVLVEKIFIDADLNDEDFQDLRMDDSEEVPTQIVDKGKGREA